MMILLRGKITHKMYMDPNWVLKVERRRDPGKVAKEKQTAQHSLLISPSTLEATSL